MIQKEQDRIEEEAALAATYDKWLNEHFTQRKIRLIKNCYDYADSDPAGLPGHNLMILVAKLANALGLVVDE